MEKVNEAIEILIKAELKESDFNNVAYITVRDNIAKLLEEKEMLLIGLHGIYNLCDNDNPTHEHIWHIANDLLH